MMRGRADFECSDFSQEMEILETGIFLVEIYVYNRPLLSSQDALGRLREEGSVGHHCTVTPTTPGESERDRREERDIRFPGSVDGYGS